MDHGLFEWTRYSPAPVENHAYQAIDGSSESSSTTNTVELYPMSRSNAPQLENWNDLGDQSYASTPIELAVDFNENAPPNRIDLQGAFNKEMNMLSCWDAETGHEQKLSADVDFHSNYSAETADGPASPSWSFVASRSRYNQRKILPISVNTSEFGTSTLPSPNPVLSPAMHDLKDAEKTTIGSLSSPTSKPPDSAAPDPVVSFRKMLQFCDGVDYCLLIAGGVFAAGCGATMPVFTVIFRQLVNLFGPDENMTRDELATKIFDIAVWFLYTAVGVFICSYGEVALLKISSQRQTRRIRVAYLQASMRQEIGWYDTHKIGELTSRISADVLLMQQGLDKAGAFIHNIATFIAGFVLGFALGWQLTLVVLAIIPPLAASGAFMGILGTRFSKMSSDAYAQAGSVAEESLQNMRVVATFGRENEQAARYDQLIAKARSVGCKAGAVSGFGYGLSYCIYFLAYALAFWYGGKLIADKTVNSHDGQVWKAGDVISVFLSVVHGGFALGQAQPATTAIQKARGAAFKVFALIERESRINPEDTKWGIVPQEPLKGRVAFKNVFFCYPSRPTVPVLNGFDLIVEQGQRIALAGGSGSGKSTTLALLLRFYEPESGSVTIDGVDISKFNLAWLRANLGLVSQEPVLFGLSIRENIAQGLKDGASEQEIIAAAKVANAHDFITKLPQGYDTRVGNKGTQLSGGQKQRIAIARAVIRNPRILLLDEATSALDTENERLVQEALDRVMVGRTSIIIAHRMSTIRNCDRICVVQGGAVVEQGTYDDLIQLGGVFNTLAARQHHRPVEEEAAKSLVETVPTHGTTHAAGVDKIAEGRDEDLGDEETQPEFEPPDMHVAFSRVLALQKSEIPFIALGCISAVGTGVSYPVFAIIVSEALKSFQSGDSVTVHNKATEMAIFFILLSIGVFFAYLGQIWMFALVGEKLTYKLRSLSFVHILRKDGAWFDQEENSPGSVTARLASDAALVQGITSDRVALLLQNVSTLITGVLIAFITGWKLALVVTVSIPIIAGASAIQMSFWNGKTSKSKSELGDAGHMISEAVSNIRTVASFGLEDSIRKRFDAEMEKIEKENIKQSHAAGVAFGFSQAIQIATFFVTLYYGGKLVASNEWVPKSVNCDGMEEAIYGTYENCVDKNQLAFGFGQMMKVFLALFMGAIGIGEAQQFAPDAKKAKRAVNSIFQLIDEPLKVDPLSPSGIDCPAEGEGEIKFVNINFSYPSRKEIQIFKNFNLTVPSGKITALCSESGSGKSTVMWLLQRLYVPDAGSIFLDGVDISSINVANFRQQLSLVGQEPTLFALSIRENIAVGKKDASEQEIIAAAKVANAHDFITKLPQGYDTYVGEKFSQLSGGQKQRIAIARAVIRNPRILLLDEATSALDTESERLVQEALDRVMVGRTSIIIAHRMSTIRHAHQIAVIREGRIVESGNHEELMAMGGYYTTLAGKH